MADVAGQDGETGGPSIHVDDDTYVLVMTGAGVSAESGIPTFRDANGLWEQHRVEDVASPDGFEADPALVWRFYSQRREAAARCAPNPGHLALAALEAKLGDRFLLATQNVDGLHRAAGNTRVVELHGNLFRTKCSRCDRPAFEDRASYADGSVGGPHPVGKLPGCARCEADGAFALLRPDIVWFGEMLDPRGLQRVAAFAAAAGGKHFVFVAVGTSGLVFPAAGMVDEARRLGADTWLINAEPAANTHRFHHFVQGPAGVVLPSLFRHPAAP